MISDFNTQQEITACKNPLNDTWIIGIDIGFSAVKGFAPNKRFCFPSYVKKLEHPLNMEDINDIYYRDETGVYLVGTNAQNLVQAKDTNDTGAMFDRDRYFTQDFKVLLRTAIGIGLMDNQSFRRARTMPVFVQTGLPAAYVKEDAPLIRRAFSESGKFDLKLGGGKWERLENTLKGEDVSVMSQPSGTLNSIMSGDDGHFRPDAKRFIAGNILIADAGFGTFDLYGVINRRTALQESASNLGMKRVLEEASAAVYKDYKVDIRISQMRKYMKAGFFKYTDIAKRKSVKIPLESYITDACKKVAIESVNKLFELSGYFQDYDILIVTGGAGAAYLPYYREALKDMEALDVLPGNDGNDLPIFYANARGYYMTAFRLKRG